MQSGLSGVVRQRRRPVRTEWRLTVVQPNLISQSSLNKLLFFLYPSHPPGLSVFNAPSAFVLILLAVLLLCVSFPLLHPVFHDLMPSFSSYFVLCLIHIINPSFYIFYSFIYLLHWRFCSLAHSSLCVSSMPTTVPG